MDEQIKVYGINATILDHGKVNGRQKWLIDITHCGGTAIDRIQCVDYRFRQGCRSISENIIDTGSSYLTWSWWPHVRGSSFLITCRCSHDLDPETAKKLIERGMNKAWKEMSKVISKTQKEPSK